MPGREQTQQTREEKHGSNPGTFSPDDDEAQEADITRASDMSRGDQRQGERREAQARAEDVEQSADELDGDDIEGQDEE